MAAKAVEQITNVIKNINEKNPYYTIVGILVIILAVDYFGVMQFQLGTLGSLNPKIAELSQNVKTAKNNIQRLPQFQSEVKDLTAKLDKVNHKIKTKEQVPVILENISRIADANGVKIEQIMPDTSDLEPVLKNNDGQYFSVPIILEARSGYHHFGRFLNQLEIEEVFLSFPDITIAASGKQPTKHTIKLIIDAIIFEKVGE